jgi:hypothetical protein
MSLICDSDIYEESHHNQGSEISIEEGKVDGFKSASYRNILKKTSEKSSGFISFNQ